MPGVLPTNWWGWLTLFVMGLQFVKLIVPNLILIRFLEPPVMHPFVSIEKSLSGPVRLFADHKCRTKREFVVEIFLVKFFEHATEWVCEPPFTDWWQIRKMIDNLRVEDWVGNSCLLARYFFRVRHRV